MKSKLIILHIIPSLAIGGAENFLTKLINYQKNSKSIEHKVICLNTVGSLGHQLKKNNINVECINLSKNFLSFCKSTLILNKKVRDSKADIVHTWMYHSDLIGGLIAKLHSKKVIWSIRTSSTRKAGSYLTNILVFINAVVSWFIPDKIICVSYSAVKIHVSIGYNKKKINYIPNGYDLNAISKLLKSKTKSRTKDLLKIKNNFMVVTSIARLNPQKDHRTFLKSANEVLKVKNNVYFICIGKDIPNLKKEVITLVNKKYHKNILLLGEKDNVYEILNISDIFCLHSIYEAFPNVLVEAMASKKICISTDVGDAREILGDNNFIVKTKEYLKLAKKILSILEYKKTVKERIENKNRLKIKNKFALSDISKKYLKIYKQVVR